MCTTHGKDDGRQMLDDSNFQYFPFLRMIYCCLLIFRSGLMPTYTACFPATFKSHAFQLTTLIPQWTYSTVQHLQNILLFYFPFFLFSLSPPLAPRRQIQEPAFLYSKWRTQFPHWNHFLDWSSVFTSVAVLSIKQEIKVRGSVEEAKAVSLSAVHRDGTTRLWPTHPEKQSVAALWPWHYSETF